MTNIMPECLELINRTSWLARTMFWENASASGKRYSSTASTSQLWTAILFFKHIARSVHKHLSFLGLLDLMHHTQLYGTSLKERTFAGTVESTTRKKFEHKTNVFCCTCNVHLCFTTRNCFDDRHTYLTEWNIYGFKSFELWLNFAVIFCYEVLTIFYI